MRQMYGLSFYIMAKIFLLHTVMARIASESAWEDSSPRECPPDATGP